MSSNLTASAILDIFLSIENEMRDLIDSSLFYFQIQRIPQKPSETFYGVVSDGLIPLKFPQIPKVPPRHLGIWGIFARPWRGVFHADAIVHSASESYATVSFEVGFAAYSEMLPQSVAVTFI